MIVSHLSISMRLPSTQLSIYQANKTENTDTSILTKFSLILCCLVLVPRRSSIHGNIKKETLNNVFIVSNGSTQNNHLFLYLFLQ